MGEISTTTKAFGTPGHSWQSVVSHGSSIAHKGLLVAAKSLALTSIHLMTNSGALEMATKEYREQKGDIEYVTAIPKEIQATLDMHTKYQDEYRKELAALNK